MIAKGGEARCPTNIPFNEMPNKTLLPITLPPPYPYSPIQLFVDPFDLYLKNFQMSQFDQDCITYTQQGRILQLEYAAKAVESAETILGVKCRDGVLLGAEKQVISKLLVEHTNKRIYNVDRAVGMVLAGKIPDGRHLMTYARNEASKFFKDFSVPISGRTLSDRLSLYLNAHTLYNAVRPFGSTEILASYDKLDGFGLYMLQTSGHYFGYSCCTAGKGRQIAKAQFEKTDFSKLTCEEALFFVAKILHLTHEENLEKKYEIEMSWISEKTNFIHAPVPRRLIDEAVTRALAAIEEDQMG